MGRKSFENYGFLAGKVQDSTILAGRYWVQKTPERNILGDIIAKLDLQPQHTLLDIGCNAGNLTIPLSFMVGSITGIDHPECLRRLREKFSGGIELIAGNFLDVTLTCFFDRILCYDVLHYLRNSDEVFEFMDKALTLLAKGGKALFGDIPNASAKCRFLSCGEGLAFDKAWQELRQQNSQENPGFDLGDDPELIQFDDNLMLEIIARYRTKGFHAYILPQVPDLPFGHTREDILITQPS